MTIEPKKVQHLRVVQLTGGYSPQNLLLRDTHQDGNPWKRVQNIKCIHMPVDGKWLDECTVVFEDGSELLYNPDDSIEVGFIY